jgi:hypothetical protein
VAEHVAAPDSAACAVGAGEANSVKKRGRPEPPAGGAIVVGVAWYSKEAWEQLRDVASDPELLEPTYEDWVKMATASLSTVRGAGLEPEMIELDISRLVAWCREQRRPIDSAARAAFTAQMLRSRRGGFSGS